MRLPILAATACLSFGLLVVSAKALLNNEGIRPGDEYLPLIPGLKGQDAIGGLPPVLGSDRARTKYVVFTDFQCPSCASEWEILKQVAAASSDIAVYVRELPLDRMHPKAHRAAVAAEIARTTGKFVQVATSLYKSDLTDNAIAKCLRDSGISDEEERLTTAQAESSVQRDLALAKGWGLHATPTVLLVQPDARIYHVLLFPQISRIEP